MPGVSITRRPSTSRLKAMVGLPRASSPTSRLITAFSVAGCFRNFRRAGVLKNNRSTVSRVPAEQPAGSAVSNSPPWIRTRNPPPPSRLRLTASTSATAAMPSATAAERIAIRWPGSIPTSGRDMFPLPGVELFQRLSRREAFQVKLLQLRNHRVIEWQAQLGAGGRPFEGPLTLELGEHLAGAHYDLARQAGQLRDMND